jgi:hypothetical protein
MSGQIDLALREINEEIDVLQRLIENRRLLRDNYTYLRSLLNKDEVSV